MSAPKNHRPKLEQPTPAQLVTDLLGIIRHVYCPGVDDKTWYKDNRRHVRDWCVLWPARFIVNKGFTLPSDRFKAILVDIITDSKRHVTGSITYLPAYLGKCVQSHFTIHWERYYNEAKSARASAEMALLALKQLPTVDRTVETLATAAAEVLKNPARKPKPVPKPAPPETQMGLF